MAQYWERKSHFSSFVCLFSQLQCMWSTPTSMFSRTSIQAGETRTVQQDPENRRGEGGHAHRHACLKGHAMIVGLLAVAQRVGFTARNW